MITFTPQVAFMSSASIKTMTLMMAPTSMSLAAVLSHDLALPAPLIPRDTLRDVVGLATLLQWQQPRSQMPSQANASYAMDLQGEFSLSELSHPPISLCWGFMVFTF